METNARLTEVSSQRNDSERLFDIGESYNRALDESRPVAPVSGFIKRNGVLTGTVIALTVMGGDLLVRSYRRKAS